MTKKRYLVPVWHPELTATKEIPIPPPLESEFDGVSYIRWEKLDDGSYRLVLFDELTEDVFSEG